MDCEEYYEVLSKKICKETTEKLHVFGDISNVINDVIKKGNVKSLKIRNYNKEIEYGTLYSNREAFIYFNFNGIDKKTNDIIPENYIILGSMLKNNNFSINVNFKDETKKKVVYFGISVNKIGENGEVDYETILKEEKLIDSAEHTEIDVTYVEFKSELKDTKLYMFINDDLGILTECKDEKLIINPIHTKSAREMVHQLLFNDEKCTNDVHTTYIKNLKKLLTKHLCANEEKTGGIKLNNLDKVLSYFGISQREIGEVMGILGYNFVSFEEIKYNFPRKYIHIAKEEKEGCVRHTVKFSFEGKENETVKNIKFHVAESGVKNLPDIKMYINDTECKFSLKNDIISLQYEGEFNFFARLEYMFNSIFTCIDFTVYGFERTITCKPHLSEKV